MPSPRDRPGADGDRLPARRILLAGCPDAFRASEAVSGLEAAGLGGNELFGTRHQLTCCRRMGKVG